MNTFLVGKVIHEILMDGNYSHLKDLTKEERQAVEVTVLTIREPLKIRLAPGMVVMDLRPLSYGKMYTIKSLKTMAIGESLWEIAVMNQNGVSLRLNQFQVRVN